MNAMPNAICTQNSTGVGTPIRPAFKRADCPYVEPDRCTGPPAEALAIPCCHRISGTVENYHEIPVDC